MGSTQRRATGPRPPAPHHHPPSPHPPSGLRGRLKALAVLLTALALALPSAAGAASGAPAADGPVITLDKREAGAGGAITVSGTGWRPHTLLTLLICGQKMIGGTNACANADGRAVTTGADGAFKEKLAVSEPPKPCPCVVHAATVTGEPAAADADFSVAGHPVAPLPAQTGGERLSVLGARLRGSSGILTWFGAPPQRQLVVTVANLGSTPAKDPVFQVGTSHGVLAPSWEEQQWRGTVAPGQKERVELPVELSAGAYGDYLVSLKYGGKTLVEQPWAVGRPWGVTLFWILLCLVIPAAVFRIGMAIVDRLRPRPPTVGTRSARRRVPGLPALPRPAFAAAHPRRPAAGRRKNRERAGGAVRDEPGSLPWFTPDTLPGAPPQASAPPQTSAPPQASAPPRTSAPRDERPRDERPRDAQPNSERPSDEHPTTKMKGTT
ncbi:neocarzinostatin apoprotein domain-containing protein [Streptomyces varsoviensis]|uniref:neocarzinostatin apoprotein domain-containing protein n=1 Tax=Streptomyces varsoviensis TaxID=67373 RepID=UPI003F4CFC03